MHSLPQYSNMQTSLPLPIEAKLPRAGQTTTKVRVLITPEVAREWLEKTNHKNRALSEQRWMKYALDMIDGRWKYNCDSIRFGCDGVLLDGQHRLMACAESGVPIETDVAFGLDPEVLDTIDIGEGRRAADTVHMEGIENATNACALAQLLLIHRKHGIQRMSQWQAKPTKTQIIKAVKDDPRISVIAGRVPGWAHKLVAPRVATFCYYLFSEQDQVRADQFFFDFAEGINLSEFSAVYHLRERLLANRIAKAKLPVIEIIALFFKAWIAYRNNRKVRTLRWRSEGSAPEKFPDITEAAR